MRIICKEKMRQREPMFMKTISTLTSCGHVRKPLHFDKTMIEPEMVRRINLCMYRRSYFLYLYAFLFQFNSFPDWYQVTTFSIHANSPTALTITNDFLVPYVSFKLLFSSTLTGQHFYVFFEEDESFSSQTHFQYFLPHAFYLYISKPFATNV